MSNQILLVDDDVSVREALGQTLELADFDTLTAGSFIEAKDHISAQFDGVVVSDIRMPGRDGFHLLDYAQGQDRELPVVLLTGEGDIPMAVRAMTNGAFGFLEKPCGADDLIAVLRRALSMRQMVLENRRFKADAEAGDPASRMVYGHSDLAQTLRERVRAAARVNTECLVRGAPGSGVSKIAEVIHLCSPRAKRIFEKRAAKGLGREELARLWNDCTGGSLFLDEISQLPSDTQMALIDLLDRGGTCLIAGTTQDLGQAAQQGILSVDLFYRLEIMQARIPALSERPEDIPVLFRHYVAQAAEQSGMAVPEISDELLTRLMAMDWPGNARALMSYAMRFVLGLDDVEQGEEMGLAQRMAQVEKSLLIDALRRTGGQAKQAAEALKLPRKTFYDKLTKYGLKPENYR
jgi:two-component system C4-dicarboxylate transport response regulator DctD